MLAIMEVPAQQSNDVTGESLSRRVEQCLRQCGYPELHNLEVIQGSDRILLQGRVRTYFLKQLAQNLVLSLPEVTAVENQLDVE